MLRQFQTRLHTLLPPFAQPFGLRFKPHINELDIDLKVLHQTHFSEIPPWQLRSLRVDFSLAKSKKSETSPLEFRTKFYEIRQELPHHVPFYTDGSKEGKRVSAAAFGVGRRVASRLPNHSSIFSAEACAMILALKCIKETTGKNFIIFSDSKSCLEDLDNLSLDHPVIAKILKGLIKFKELGYDIRFCWVPSHVGIKGNEEADKSAKRGLSHEEKQQRGLLPPSDFKPAIKIYVDKVWQKHWEEHPGRKLFSFCKSINGTSRHGLAIRKDQIVFTRCRIGHSRLTNSYLLKGEDPPQCIVCDETLTIEHILLECIDFTPVRQGYYRVADLKELFNTIKPDLIIDFLKAAGLYTLI